MTHPLAFIVSDGIERSDDEKRWRHFESVWSGIGGYLGDMQRGFTSRAQSMRQGYCERRGPDVACYCTMCR